ncbi:NgoMIV family type II restriction endonuclease [Streptomyces sp. G-G2]|uniref:NgoMIV family type II restriction endonuclease n=1 Tax=Streptomyces sp. G-G2 TaxID=3046201 RepID=UPI0024B8C928|nr:NgoMIV family type II restriction endonuclease [Streptomyces sp. G-G2]MDJ0379644.1 NgoMIV family type II restriction endonuclease [Streptomyces sp. G-G2]
MPAPFVASLCGYRNGRPNTSDANDKQSIDLGTAFFESMGIAPGKLAPSDAVGNLMASTMAADLSQYFQVASPHLMVQPERSIASFEQFSHLNATATLRKDSSLAVTRRVKDLRDFSAASTIAADVQCELDTHLDGIHNELEILEGRRRDLLDLLGEESLLKLDITVSRSTPGVTTGQNGPRHLVAGLSLKWTLRTDRAQDCRSQGAKMASLRRGRMPHFATVTMEPRPSMLALLGRGSGEIDCVYHLNLPALSQAIDEYCAGNQPRARLGIRDNFRRLCDQRRLRDYDELREYVATL